MGNSTWRAQAAWLLVFLATGGITAVSQEPANEDQKRELREGEFDLETSRVIVFKDGYCLVVKKGKVKTDAEGRAFTDEVPDAAVLGSFWALPDENSTLKHMVAGWEETEETIEKAIDCRHTMDVVEANIGRECSLQIDGDTFQGKLVSILGETQKQTADENLLREMGAMGGGFVSLPSISSTATSTIERPAATMFVLRTNNGDVLVNANNVQQIKIIDMQTKVTRKVTQKARHKRLNFTFEQANADVEMTLMYFRPGVRWIPTYRVNLTEELVKQKDGKANRIAEIHLQGELLNEAEDLLDTPIDVVVGVPNFRFKSVPSPMVLEATLRNLLVQAAPQIMGGNNGFSNQMNYVSNSAIYQQRSGEVRSARATGGASASVEMPEELSGQGTNDLFVYSLPKMTLRSGERATVPILSTQAPYRDVYTWDIELKHSESYAATASSARSPLRLEENKVWRQVELVNNTKLPWTTGAAMFVDGYQPLAQELLTYTSPGGICRIPVTVAVDLRGKATDEETSRELKALKWRGYDYAKVAGAINVELANNKDVDVEVEVNVRFGGKAVKTSDEGKITLESYRQQDWTGGRGDVINNSSKVFWKSTVKPGECFKPNVNYEFFVRY